MRIELSFTPTALRDLERLDRQVAQRILRALARFEQSVQGDIVRLQGTTDEYRLRVGDWRVRFQAQQVNQASETLDLVSEPVRLVTTLRILP